MTAFQLRPYQKKAVDAAIKELKRSIEPCLIDAAPAAGKSYVIAALAHWFKDASGGKRVLCLAPSAELVTQNHEKYLLTGEPASIFSASAGAKSTRHVVVFGTPKTVQNAISRFQTGFCAVIVDEAHGITPTIRAIIEAMRETQPNLRVLGLSGTPYRLGSGYIYRLWPDGRANGDDTCRDPYFTQCVYRVSAREMLAEGFITPMTIGAIHAGAYDTSGIVLLPNGTLNPDTVERAFEGHGRKTSAIVADVIEQARAYSGGVMYFAATKRHALEIMASLPPATSAYVLGDECAWNGRKMARKDIIKAYRAQKSRHLVSVGTLTTGFDVSHTAVIALLRYTESAALLQQILGRAWRLDDAKPHSLLLDYAENVERHFPDGDIYNPEIKAGKISGGGTGIEAECPDCGNVNTFSLNLDCADYQRDKHGYCLDAFGERVETEYGPMPAHYGRRCFGQVRTGPKGEYERCNYRWTGKDCPHCGEVNDIAARFCHVCKGEIVDPNKKLVADFKAMKRDPTVMQCDEVIAMTTREGVSQRGNRTLRIDWITPHRQFSTWLQPDGPHTKAMREFAAWQAATDNGQRQPTTITYRKDQASGFFQIFGYDKPADQEPVPEQKRKAA
jgi:DNA repair protein RadD